ncbi:MAG: glycosyltransferase family 4 protein [Sphingobacteriaceae bacterium]|nr:glycosyltransferase family 4 protein [Sphingobacteriaceae bacterium]
MKIALITDGIWPYVMGGMQKHSYYLCKYLAKQKIQVTLFHFNQSNLDIQKLDCFTAEEKKYIHSIIVDFPNKDNLPGHYIRNSKKHAALVFDAMKNSILEYDFIYTKGFTGWKLIELKSQGKIKCAPIGVKFHGYEMFQKMPGPKAYLDSLLLLRKPVKYISRHADVVFSYGAQITEIIKSIGVKESHIIEIPSGVEEEIVSEKIIPSTNKVKFTYLGRYERRKGIEELNKAIQGLDFTNYEFHFIGPIPENKRLKLPQVFYHGEIRDKNELKQLLLNFHVLVCPSWSEGFPNVILEGMASGLSILATDVGANRLLVNDETGFLIKKPNVKILQKELKEIADLDNYTLDVKRNNALRLIKQKFTWEKISLQLLNEIKACIKK